MYNIIITLILLLIHTHARAHPRGRGRRRSALYFLLQTNSRRSTSLFLSFERVVVQKFLDQIHVTHEHASTAVSLQLQRVQRVLLGVIRLQQIEVRVPLVSNHLMRERSRQTTREKTAPLGGRDRDDAILRTTTIDSSSSLSSSSSHAAHHRKKATTVLRIDRSIQITHRHFCGSLRRNKR